MFWDFQTFSDCFLCFYCRFGVREGFHGLPRSCAIISGRTMPQMEPWGPNSSPKLCFLKDFVVFGDQFCAFHLNFSTPRGSPPGSRSPEALPWRADPQPPRPRVLSDLFRRLRRVGGGEGFALPPKRPHLKFMRGFAPQTHQNLKSPLLCAPEVVPLGALGELKI